MPAPKRIPGKGGGPKRPHSGQFKKGYDPRRKPVQPGEQRGTGRGAANASIKDALAPMMRMNLEDVKKIYEDKDNQPIARLLAAQRVLVAMGDLGKRSDDAFSQIADRVDGKPHQSHEVKVAQQVDPAQLIEELREQVGELEAPATQQELTNLNEDGVIDVEATDGSNNS